MPGLFVLAIILAVIATLLGAGSFILNGAARREEAERLAQEEALKADDRDSAYRDSYRRSSDFEMSSTSIRNWLRVASGVVLGLALLCTFISSATVVSTKNVGIETVFGRPVGNLSNGFHFVAPWAQVTEMDAAIQTDSHVKDEKDSSCISVRIAHQAVACVDTSIRWRIEEAQAGQLFKDYRHFESVRDSLVTRDLNAALNTVFESYDPLAIDKDGNSTAASLNSLSAQVTRQMQGAIGTQINVLSVIIPVIHYDDNTQGRINALMAQIAQTRIARQAVVTAEQQALANQTLANSVSKDPNVLVSRCFDLLSEMVTKAQTIPIGFSCWPGGSSSVVVPGVASSGNQNK